VYDFIAEQWRSAWWLYAIAMLIFLTGGTVAAARVLYGRKHQQEPSFVGILSDVTVLAFMVYLFLVFTRVVTGFYH
jgi:hypothetical protein